MLLIKKSCVMIDDHIQVKNNKVPVIKNLMQANTKQIMLK